VVTQEEGRIVTTLNNVANTESQFSQTKDAASILHFYTEDYAGIITDEKLETCKDQQQYLAVMSEQINSGEPIGISSKVMNITPSVAGRLGWATYEYEYKIMRSGVLQKLSHGHCTAIFRKQEDLKLSHGHCTAIFRKQEDLWLMRHKHCSTANPTPFFLTPK